MPSHSVFFPAFGLYLPSITFPLQEQNIHPLSVTMPDGLDLEYSALMAFDNIVIDKGARAHIMDARRKYLRPMRDTISALEGEGLLTITDFSEAATRLMPSVESKTNILLENPDLWRSKAAEHWRIYQSILPPLLEKYEGHCDLEQEKLHFGVYCYLRRQSDKINIHEGHRLNKFIASKAKLRNEFDRNLFRDLIRPIFQHTVLNTLLRDEIDCPFIDWDDLYVYYNGISRLQLSETAENQLNFGLATQSREVFSVALPDLKPRNVGEFIQFRKTSNAIRSLRQELINSARAGIALDEKWAAKLRDDANRAQLTASRRSKIIRWILLPLKILVPIPIVGDLAGELVAKAIESGADEGIDHVNSRGMLKYKWYYTLIEINPKN